MFDYTFSKKKNSHTSCTCFCRFNRFVNLSPEIAENFKCSICLDIFDNPLELSCGHIFCSVCIRSLFNNGNKCECPECRRLVMSQEVKPPNKKLLCLLHSFDIKCDNVNVGCCMVVKLENLEQHTRLCHLNIQPTPSAPCDDSNDNVNPQQVTILIENIVSGLTQRVHRPSPSENTNRFSYTTSRGSRFFEICTSFFRNLCRAYFSEMISRNFIKFL